MKIPCGKVIQEFGAGDRDCGAYCPFCKIIHYCPNCVSVISKEETKLNLKYQKLKREQN